MQLFLNIMSFTSFEKLKQVNNLLQLKKKAASIVTAHEIREHGPSHILMMCQRHLKCVCVLHVLSSQLAPPWEAASRAVGFSQTLLFSHVVTPSSHFPTALYITPGINYFMLLVGIISHIFYLKHWLTDCPQTALNPRTSCSCYVFTGYFSPLCTSNHLPEELKEKKKAHTHKTNRWKMRDCTESRICSQMDSVWF